MGQSQNKHNQEETITQSGLQKINSIQRDRFQDDTEELIGMIVNNHINKNSVNYELSFQAEGLKNMDFFSKSDPLLALYLISEEQEVYIGRTEVVQDSLEPVFQQKLIVPFLQNIQQSLKVVIYDVDEQQQLDDFDKHDLIGQCFLELKKLVLMSFDEQELKDQKDQKTGKVKIQIREIDFFAVKTWLTVEVTDLLIEGLIFFVLLATNKQNQSFILYQSDKIPWDNKGIIFPKFRIVSNSIESDNSQLRFEFWEKRVNKQPKQIGELQTSIIGLRNTYNQQLNILGNYVVVGKMMLKEIEDQYNTNFMSYLNKGYKLQLVYGLDLSDAFKKSNQQTNEIIDMDWKIRLLEFQKNFSLIQSVFNRFLVYKESPVYGLSALLCDDHETYSSIVALNGDINNPYMNDQYSFKDLRNCFWYNLNLILNHFIEFNINIAEFCQKENSKEYVVNIVFIYNIPKDLLKLQWMLLETQDLPLSFVFIQLQTEQQQKMITEIYPQFESIDQYFKLLEEQFINQNKLINITFIQLNKPDYSFEEITRLVFGNIPKQFIQYQEKITKNSQEINQNKSQKLSLSKLRTLSLNSLNHKSKSETQFYKYIQKQYQDLLTVTSEFNERLFNFLTENNTIKLQSLDMEYLHFRMMDFNEAKQKEDDIKRYLITETNQVIQLDFEYIIDNSGENENQQEENKQKVKANIKLDKKEINRQQINNPFDKIEEMTQKLKDINQTINEQNINQSLDEQNINQSLDVQENVDLLFIQSNQKEKEDPQESKQTFQDFSVLE